MSVFFSLVLSKRRIGLASLLFQGIGFTWHVEMVAHLIGVLNPMATSYFAISTSLFAAAES
jgi:hypothetical protein